MQTRSTQHGFTLVEMIASLVILGVVAMVGTLGMAEVMRSYVMTSDHSSMSQKTQVALARLYLELQHLAEVTASGDTSITYRPRFTFAQGILD
ncbi:MAG: prepilin-type N-terminal cleavage/methylation domain-containing protein, partial [Desulfovibrio sp.]|nr:prepilin-type N-terminal cleavage/methylation domain-containing protein [Desulfovibrio sp.]